MAHVRGAPYHPQTQGKIERCHLTLKNRTLLDNYYLPSHLEHQISEFIRYYNHHRYHESLNNLTPAGVYFGRSPEILQRRIKIKQQTLKQRALQHHANAA
jgi:transposase InsO family protein